MAGATRPDLKLLAPTLYRVVVERPAPSTEQPQGLGLDNGDDYEEGRATRAGVGCTAHLRARGAEAHARKRRAGFTARRWVGERTQSWLNRLRRLLIRWDTKADTSLGFLHFACALIAFRAAGLFG